MSTTAGPQQRQKLQQQHELLKTSGAPPPQGTPTAGMPIIIGTQITTARLKQHQKRQQQDEC
jgi:hypothetical protein